MLAFKKNLTHPQISVLTKLVDYVNKVPNIMNFINTLICTQQSISYTMHAAFAQFISHVVVTNIYGCT